MHSGNNNDGGRMKTTFKRFHCQLNDRLKIDFNPVVTLVSAGIIWGFVVWCFVDPSKASEIIHPLNPWITRKFSWLYIATENVWVLFVLVIFWKFGKIKLGKENTKPEYSNVSYFAMLFAAGVGIGMYYYGVSEVVQHYAPQGCDGKTNRTNRYSHSGTDNERAQSAMTQVLLHWGVHGWCCYVVVGLSISVVSYRSELPVTLRSGLYPIIGKHINGWLGDLVDILSILVILLGVSTSLGLGAGQLNAGLHRINPNIVSKFEVKLAVIWIVTGITALSVVSGINKGIRRLSEVCLSIGTFILLLVLLNDNPWYLLNICVQSSGHYLTSLLSLGFHTDAFSQEANALDGKEDPSWMSDWTIFYWGWWIAWAPFVGMFIARISKGRTVREYIVYNVLLTVGYVFVWFCILSGASLKTEREALLPNSTTDRLSCSDGTDMLFKVLNRYEIGSFLTILSFISMTIYFVTSSDSASLVIDSICANGEQDPPVVQRLFWSATLGALTSGLLLTDRKSENYLLGKYWAALQSVTVAGSLPYVVVLNLMCLALWRSLKHAANKTRPEPRPEFSMTLLDAFSSFTKLPKLAMCVLAPWYFVGRAYGKLEKAKYRYSIIIMIVVACLFYSTFVLFALEELQKGLFHVGIAVYLVFAAYCSRIRTEMRDHCNIEGNPVEDFFAFLVLYPLSAYQLDDHMEESCEIYAYTNTVNIQMNA